MKKKFSDHISRAFLDKPGTRKKRGRPYLFILVSLCIVALFVSAATRLEKLKSRRGQHGNLLGESIYIEKHDGPYVLAFDFLDASTKIRSLCIDIPNIDLSEFDELKFSARVEALSAVNLGVLKVRLESARRETADTYVDAIDESWKTFTIAISDFGGSVGLSSLSRLFFVVEEWNVYPKEGRVLVDELRFFKKRI